MDGCTYLMPIRRSVFDAAEAEALRSYFETIQRAASEVTVVDGSPPEVFAAHHQFWSAICRHEPVEAER